MAEEFGKEGTQPEQSQLQSQSWLLRDLSSQTSKIPKGGDCTTLGQPVLPQGAELPP